MEYNGKSRYSDFKIAQHSNSKLPASSRQQEHDYDYLKYPSCYKIKVQVTRQAGCCRTGLYPILFHLTANKHMLCSTYLQTKWPTQQKHSPDISSGDSISV